MAVLGMEMDCLFHYSLKGVLLARLAKESKKWFFASAFSICSAWVIGQTQNIRLTSEPEQSNRGFLCLELTSFMSVSY